MNNSTLFFALFLTTLLNASLSRAEVTATFPEHVKTGQPFDIHIDQFPDQESSQIELKALIPAKEKPIISEVNTELGVVEITNPGLIPIDVSGYWLLFHIPGNIPINYVFPSGSVLPGMGIGSISHSDDFIPEFGLHFPISSSLKSDSAFHRSLLHDPSRKVIDNVDLGSRNISANHSHPIGPR